MTMYRKLSACVAAAVLAAATPAQAHTGSRVWIGSANGRLVTYASNNDLSPTTYSESRWFVGGYDEDEFAVNGQLDHFPLPGSPDIATEFPGYQIRLDGNSGISTGTQFTFNMAAPLLVFDPASNAYKTAEFKYGQPGPAPRMAGSVGSNPAILTPTGPGTAAGYNFLSYNGSGDHGHIVMTLYGNGLTSSDGPAAVYALPMSLSGGGKATSKTYYILLGRLVGLEDAAFQSAILTASQIFDRTPGDANLDGTVNTDDFNLLAQNFNGTGKRWQTGDFNFDDVTNALDFNALATNFGATSPAPALGTVVPEPAISLALMGICLMLGLSRDERACI